MPYYAIGGDGEVVEQFSRQKQATDAYELNNLIHVVIDAKKKVLIGEVPDGVDLDAAIASAPAKKTKAKAAPADAEVATRKSGGQKGGRGCPVCKVQMVPGLPAPDSKNLKGTAFRKCPQCGYTRWHPIAHVAMLLAETGWPTYRDTLGGGQRAARRVIELVVDGGLTGPEAYAQVVEESKTWEDWAPGRTAQRALDAKRKEAEQAAKQAEKEAKAAERAAAKEAKAAERQAEKERKAAERAAAKAEKEAKAAEVEGQQTLDEALEEELVSV